jgi:hypothetical protein
MLEGGRKIGGPRGKWLEDAENNLWEMKWNKRGKRQITENVHLT